MRKILFRAVAKGDLKTMVYGYYHYDSQTDTHYICLKDSLIRKEIDPDTLGQFINSNDAKGVKVYEKDILLAPSGMKLAVFWNEEELRWSGRNKEGKIFSLNLGILKVIGTIHENPELL